MSKRIKSKVGNFVWFIIVGIVSVLLGSAIIIKLQILKWLAGINHIQIGCRPTVRYLVEKLSITLLPQLIMLYFITL